MGEPQTPHFYDLGISGRVQTPQNQLFFWRHQDTQNNQEFPGAISNIICTHFKNQKPIVLTMFEKTGAGK